MEAKNLDQEDESESDCFYKIIESTVVNCSNRFVGQVFKTFVVRLKKLRAWEARDFITALIDFKETGSQSYIREFFR